MLSAVRAPPACKETTPRNRVAPPRTHSHCPAPARRTERMPTPLSPLLGPLLVVAFCLSQALRDVYFGHLFQGVDFFAVILVAFTLSTLVFGTVTAIRAPAQFKILRAHVPTVLAMNATTALAWSCYFFALTHLEPSIVNTVHSGMGPLTVIALAAGGVRLAKPGVIGRGELWS